MADDKTEREWHEFCRPFVYLNGSHEMPNYPAFCRAVLALASHTGEAEPMPEGWKLVEKKTCYVLLDGDTVVASLAGPDAERYAAIIARNLATPPAATPAAPGEVTDERLQALWDEACKDSPSNPGWSRHLRFGRAVAAISHPAPVAAPAQGALEKALDIRIGQGWQLGGNACPVLYTDTINGEQVRRDDLWLATTAGLKGAPAPASEAVAWMRKWAFDNEAPYKVPNLRGRLVLAGKFKMLPVTKAKIFDDDIALSATPGYSADAPVQQAGEATDVQTMVDKLLDVVMAALGRTWLTGGESEEIRALIRAALKGEQPVASHPATNVSHNDASGSSVSDKQPVEPSGGERGEV